MSALDLRVLVLERLSRRWITNETGGGSGTAGQPGPAPGQVGAVAFWQSGTGLTYDALLFYNHTQHWLGIGTATPTAPLTFATTLGQKMHLYASGPTRYGLAIANGTLQIFAPSTGGNIHLGDMSHTDGVTFTSRLVVNDTAVNIPNVPVGLSTPAVAGYALRVGPYLSTFLGPVGIGYDPVAGTWLKAGNSVLDALSVVGNTQLAGVVGIAGAPNGSYNLTNHGSSYLYGAVGLGTLPNPAYALVCGGASYFGGYVSFTSLTGFGYPPVANLWIRAGVSQFDQLGVGYPPQAGHAISAGGITCDFLGAYGLVDTRFAVRCYAAMYCDGIPYSAYPGPWQAFSDRRMKTNIQPIPDALDTMTRLRGVLYEWRDPAAHGHRTGMQMGVIAQEVEEVVPSWVGELSGFKTTQLSAFEALAIESFKALTQRVAALEEVLCQ